MIKLIYSGKNIYVIILLQIFLLSPPCYSQTTDTTDFSNLSLENLMKNKSQGIPSELESKMNSAIEVASLTPMIARNSPSIVSVISEEEIRRSGARDLIDILRSVPGIDFGLDVQGDVGIGIRGNWANEAKVLMQINGMRMNEITFGTLVFANRYPIDQIKRIEIIRGPGSAIYGGEAEYAVINIITKSADDLNGVQVNATYGRMEHALAENNYTLAIGKKMKDFNFTLTNFFGQSNRSDQPYTDIYGNTYDMAEHSQIKPVNFNLGLNYKALTVHAFYDHVLLKTRDGNIEALNETYTQNFETIIADAAYTWKMSDKFSLTPKISFYQTNPWEIELETQSSEAQDSTKTSGADQTVAHRYLMNITSIWNISKNINVSSGFESFIDKGNMFNGEVFRNSGKAEVSYYNTAVFIHSLIKNRIANLILGARYDNNNSFGGAFVPRAGLTKRIEKFNFKLLYSNSFKAPAIENVETSLMGRIKPEMTQIWEFESGYQINKDMFITVNLFDIATKNTIVYVVDTSLSQGASDGFINRDESGSQGIEMEYKFIGKWGYMNLGYSYYTNQNKPIIPEYTYLNNDHDVLAFSNNKITLNGSFNLSKSVFISPSFLYYSKKDGIYSTDLSGNYLTKEFPATFYANVFVGDNNFLVKGLQASIGVYDIFNQKTIYVQPFNSGHAPLPGASRELSVRLNYNFHFK